MPPNPYESEKLLSEHLLFHYGNDDELLPYSYGPVDALHYPVRSVGKLIDRTLLVQPGSGQPGSGQPGLGQPGASRALDLGCAVGRSTLELTRYCTEVIGIDYSRSFIDAAKQIVEHGALDYSMLEEGSRVAHLRAELPRGRDILPERVSFEVGDAESLREGLGTFSVVHLANLLCRLKQPSNLLRQLAGLVHSGGQVLITTPCTWMSEYTASQHWLCGTNPDGSERSTLQGIALELSTDFDCVYTTDLPFLIRETARKFQWTVAQGSRWVRK